MTQDTAAAGVAPDWAALLRAQGLRATRQRLAVLETVHDGGHLLADETAQRVRAQGGPSAEITLQSVYVILGDLERAGLIRKVDLGHGPALFETRVGDNHHHAVCRVCGAVEDVPCAVGHAPCLDPGASGMRIDTAEVIFRGVCRECQSAGLGTENSTEHGVKQ